MISEKTLELNITHEILSLGGLFDYMLKCATQPPWLALPHDWFWQWERFSLNRPIFATGLSLSDEKRQGWDVRIDFDGTGNQPTRALFLQFKAGKHRQFSRDIASEFHGSRSFQSPFCQFGLNNNSSKNQHVVLRGISNVPNFAGAVAYAFPRIPNATALKACAGRLIHVTSFVSIPDIDALAAQGGVVIEVGHEHKYNTSYNPPLVEEICSEPTSLESLPDCTAEVVGDILTAQVYRSMTDIQRWALGASSERFEIGKAGKQTFHLFALEVARYFAISPQVFEQVMEIPLSRPQSEALEYTIKMHDFFEGDYFRAMDRLYTFGSLRPQAGRAELFTAVISRLKTYRRLLESGDWIGAQIPDLECKRAVVIPPGGLDIPLGRLRDFVSEDQLSLSLRSISYLAF